MKRIGIFTLVILSSIFLGCAPEIRSYYLPSNANPTEVYLDADDNLLIVIEDQWAEIELKEFIGYQGEPVIPRFNSKITVGQRTSEYSDFFQGTPDKTDLSGYSQIVYKNQDVYAAGLHSLGYFGKRNIEVKVKENTIFPARKGGPKILGYVLVKPSGKYGFFYIEKDKETYFHEGGFMGWSD